MKRQKTVIVRLLETTRKLAKVKSARSGLTMMKWIENAVVNSK